MDNTIYRIAKRVRTHLLEAEGGHDWRHIERVWKNTTRIAQDEQVDNKIVSLAALLHDIADPKFYDGDESIGPKMARQWLEKEGVQHDVIEHVTDIIRYMSFKNSFDQHSWSSIELKVVQDADRLDAIGAVGIARAFSYGGHKGRAMFDPDIAPMTEMTKEQYKNSQAPTINHFYEKLLKIKSMMNTDTGKALAQQRHDYMITFLEQFYIECGIRPQWHTT